MATRRAPRNGGGTSTPETAPESAPAPESYLVNNKVKWPGPDGTTITALPGETRNDLPEQSIEWLVEQGEITPTSVVERLDDLKAAIRRDGSAD